MSKEKIVADSILENIGGMDNIKSMEHCATRLRLILKDNEKINSDEIEKIDSVKGQFMAAGQYQIILGTGFVNKVYGCIKELNSNIKADNKSEAYENMTLIQKISRILGDIFVPIIPVLVATGMFMGIRGLITNLGVNLDGNLLVLSQVLTDTAFAFLPALVAYSAMKRFGGTPIVGFILGLMLVAPQLPNAYSVASGATEPIYMSLLGLSIPIVGYQGSVLPALVIAIIAAKLEKYLRKIVPNVLDLIVTPFLTLLVSMIIGLLIVGPIMHQSEVVILGLVKSFITIPYGIGAFIVGGLNQFIVVTGVHHVFSALEIDLLANTGSNVYNAIVTGTATAQGAAALAVAFKTKNKNKRSLYISSAIPAFLGITEPSVFGVNLRFIKPFICGCIGAAVAAMVAGMMNLAATGMGMTGLPGILLYLNGQVLGYLVILSISIVVSFILTYIVFKPEE